MIILSDSEDRFHNLITPGSYEWTYFDGLSDDAEWGFVAIWFRGCPMSPWYTAAIDRFERNPGSTPPSPMEYCAFNFGLYHRGRRVFHILEESGDKRFGTEPGKADARLGSNAVRGEIPRTGSGSYLLYIDAKAGPGMARLVGDIEITAKRQDLGGLGVAYDPAAEGHFWVPAALDGAFTARLDLWRPLRGTTKARFRGRAYHDRNFGTRPLHHLRADWHWGRIHSDSRTFVYFAVMPDDRSSTPFQRFFLLDTGRLLLHDAMELHGSDRRRAVLPYPREIIGESAGTGLRFTASERGNLDAGPFYHRLLSDLVVTRNGEHVLSGPGITEFLRPPRLGVAAFRPFVKFRVRARG